MRPGEVVALIQNDVWCKVLLKLHTGHKRARNSSFYWNYCTLDGSNPTGGYLFPGESWGVLRGRDIETDLTAVDIVLPRSGSQEEVVPQ